MLYSAPDIDLFPVAIDGTWVVVGYYQRVAARNWHGYLRTPDGNFTTFDPPGAVSTFATSMNDIGTVAGYFYDPNNWTHGYLLVQ